MGVLAATPVQTPVPATTVACAVLLLDQLPPAVPQLTLVLEPTHTENVPVMVLGLAFTVTGVIAKQPVLSV